jgi:hypothetical protein
MLAPASNSPGAEVHASGGGGGSKALTVRDRVPETFRRSTVRATVHARSYVGNTTSCPRSCRAPDVCQRRHAADNESNQVWLKCKPRRAAARAALPSVVFHPPTVLQLQRCRRRGTCWSPASAHVTDSSSHI